ncbi:hypothetical protein ES703_24774 [subsurface metagenome]
MTTKNNAPLLMQYHAPGGEMRSWGKYEPRRSPDPGNVFSRRENSFRVPGQDRSRAQRSPFSGAQNRILEYLDPRGGSPGSPMEKPRLQVHRSLRSHFERKASKSGLPHRCRPTQYLVVPRARSGTRHHKILVPRQAREKPPTLPAHSRPRIYLTPPLSRAAPGISSPRDVAGCRKRKKNTKGK